MKKLIKTIILSIFTLFLFSCSNQIQESPFCTANEGVGTVILNTSRGNERKLLPEVEGSFSEDWTFTVINLDENQLENIYYLAEYETLNKEFVKTFTKVVGSNQKVSLPYGKYLIIAENEFTIAEETQKTKYKGMTYCDVESPAPQNVCIFVTPSAEESDVGGNISFTVDIDEEYSESDITAYISGINGQMILDCSKSNFSYTFTNPEKILPGTYTFIVYVNGNLCRLFGDDSFEMLNGCRITNSYTCKTENDIDSIDLYVTNGNTLGNGKFKYYPINFESAWDMFFDVFSPDYIGDFCDYFTVTFPEYIERTPYLNLDDIMYAEQYFTMNYKSYEEDDDKSFTLFIDTESECDYSLCDVYSGAEINLKVEDLDSEYTVELSSLGYNNDTFSIQFGLHGNIQLKSFSNIFSNLCNKADICLSEVANERYYIDENKPYYSIITEGEYDTANFQVYYAKDDFVTLCKTNAYDDEYYITEYYLVNIFSGLKGYSDVAFTLSDGTELPYELTKGTPYKLKYSYTKPEVLESEPLTTWCFRIGADQWKIIYNKEKGYEPRISLNENEGFITIDGSEFEYESGKEIMVLCVAAPSSDLSCNNFVRRYFTVE